MDEVYIFVYTLYSVVSSNSRLDRRDSFANPQSLCYNRCSANNSHIGAIILRRHGSSLAVTAAVLIAFWLIWSKLRIVLWVQVSVWQILLLFVVLAVVLYLGLDHIFNRSR